MCLFKPLEPVKNIGLKEILKKVVIDCIDIEENPYDFKDDFIQSSDFDFCLLTSQFLFIGTDDDSTEIYNLNLFNYCVRNNYKELFVISTEYINTEYKIFDNGEWSLAYKFTVGIDNFSTIRVNFNYGISALLFPEDRSFLILLTDSYDIIAGSRYFIEEIIENNIFNQAEIFLEDLYKPNDYIKSLSSKYLKLIDSKHIQ